MRIEMSPGTVRMAEELTRARAVEHGAALVVALNGASEYAALLAEAPEFAEHARRRAALYQSARSAMEDLFAGLDVALAESSVEAHRPPVPCTTPDCVQHLGHPEHCQRADGSIILRERAKPAGEIARAALRSAIDTMPKFFQPCWLVVRYEDDLEEHRLPIENGGAVFGMTGTLKADEQGAISFLEDMTGRREVVDLKCSRQVCAGWEIELDENTRVRIAAPGVVPISKRMR